MSIGARAVVTTHATELKLFAHAADHTVNASVRFDPQTYAPTFAIDVGTPGQSLAFPLARAMHLDEPVIDRAEILLGDSEREYDRALADLAQRRLEADAEHAAAARDRGALAKLRSELQGRIEALDADRRKVLQQAEERLAQRLARISAGSSNAALESRERGGRVTRGQSELLARTIEEMRRELGLERTARPSATSPASSRSAIAFTSRRSIRRDGRRGLRRRCGRERRRACASSFPKSN